ncbi:MAG: hypothetical protein RR303_09710 [Bacteroidales bacterium]
MKKHYLFFILLCFMMGQASALTYKVTVPGNTEICYLVGDITKWEFVVQMDKISENVFQIELPEATVDMAYKYCSGNGWKYVEKGPNGEEVENRIYSPDDMVASWAMCYSSQPGLWYRVYTPAYTRECYLVGEMNNWRFLHPMDRVEPGYFELYVPTATMDMQYKYCMDSSWDHVEADEAGNDVADRSYYYQDFITAWLNYTLQPGLYISGSFNNWTDIDKMSANQDGVYLFFKTLSPGIHYYWIFDEHGRRESAQRRRISIEKERVVSFYARTPDNHFSDIDSIYLIGPAVSDWTTPVAMTRESGKLVYNGMIRPLESYKMIKQNEGADIRWNDLTHHNLITPPGETTSLTFGFKTFEMIPENHAYDTDCYLITIYAPQGDIILPMKSDPVSPNLCIASWTITDDAQYYPLLIRHGFSIENGMMATSITMNQISGFQTGDIEFVIDKDQATPENNYALFIRTTSALSSAEYQPSLNFIGEHGRLQVIASEITDLHLVDLSGRNLIRQTLPVGVTYFSVPAGIYFANGHKVIVF